MTEPLSVRLSSLGWSPQSAFELRKTAGEVLEDSLLFSQKSSRDWKSLARLTQAGTRFMAFTFEITYSEQEVSYASASLYRKGLMKQYDRYQDQHVVLVVESRALIAPAGAFIKHSFWHRVFDRIKGRPSAMWKFQPHSVGSSPASQIPADAPQGQMETLASWLTPLPIHIAEITASSRLVVLFRPIENYMDHQLLDSCARKFPLA